VDTVTIGANGTLYRVRPLLQAYIFTAKTFDLSATDGVRRVTVSSPISPPLTD
jgi:hypothetical protein